MDTKLCNFLRGFNIPGEFSSFWCTAYQFTLNTTQLVNISLKGQELEIRQAQSSMIGLGKEIARQLIIILKFSLNTNLNYKVLTRLKTNAFEFTKIFSKCMLYFLLNFYSFPPNWLIVFQIFTKSFETRLVASAVFQKSPPVQILETCRPIGKRELHLQF